MPVYKCPRCGRTVVLPEGTYYCKKCGPEAIMEAITKSSAEKLTKKIREVIYSGKSISDSTCIPFEKDVEFIAREFKISKREAENLIEKTLKEEEKKDYPKMFKFFNLLCYGWE